MDEDILDSLLAAATEQLEDADEKYEAKKCEEIPKANAKILTEVDLFQPENDTTQHLDVVNCKSSAVHSGDTDSSDDEGNRNYEEQKYSACGKGIKNLLLSDSTNSISSGHYGIAKKRISTWQEPNIAPARLKDSKTLPSPKSESKPQDVFLDPIFCMRIINPKISSLTLAEKMEGRLAVSFRDLSRQILNDNLKNKDWVICGVVVNKTPPKISQKGSQYSIWTLSDLKDDIKTVTVFMFGSAHKDLYKTMVGVVVGILNPNLLDKREGSKDEACLGVETAQKVMILGDSKDFGTCKSIKKNGDKCTAIVNLSNCEYCIYHIKQEYQKCSRRSELQSNFVGKGLVNLRNKVLGKNEVFYAGKSYTAIPAKKSKKLEAKDNGILENLSGLNNNFKNIVKAKKKINVSKKGMARHLEVNPAQRAQDLELLKKLGGSIDLESKTTFSGVRSNTVSLGESKANALSVINKLKSKTDEHNSSYTVNDAKYNLKGDLFYDVDSKSDFAGRTSEAASTGDSKKLALSLVNKLKCKEQTVSNYKNKDSSGSSAVNTTVAVASKKLPRETKTNDNIKVMSVPTLSTVNQGNFIDLNTPITKKHVNKAKVNAIKYIQSHGPIKKIDPNSTKSSATKKRNPEISLDEPLAKKSKLQESEFISDRFKKMMAMTSRHADLVERHDNEEKEKYFQKLEAKERMEEKMTNTHKVKCKAVKCLQCKYTSFSASDMCKSERHPLKVCKKFNEIGSKLLSRGFIQLEKRHAAIYKRVKSALPRRESERKSHPLARHSDILQAVETRLSMLNMTYMRFIENHVTCFIPGKVLDETRSILDLVESNKSPPRTHQLLQELRDLSSMAIEHFDEHILPRCREQLEHRSGTPEKILKELEVVAGSLTPFTKFQGFMYKNFASTSKQPARILIHQQLPIGLATELYKINKVVNTHKNHIRYLTHSSQTLCLKLRKQNNKLRIQAAKLHEQERRIQEQNAKISEQDAALVDVKKHLDEWDQKFKDLTSELVRAREEILLKTSTSSSPIINNPLLKAPATVSTTSNPPSATFENSYKSNIKPRLTHIFPKSYLGFDLDRKRKSSTNSEIPLKRNRSPTATVVVPSQSSNEKPKKIMPNINLKVPDLVTFEKKEPSGDGETRNDCNKEALTANNTESSALLSSFFDNLLGNKLRSNKLRKRKMIEEIDLT